jgi:signal transduction histidine kinase
MCWTEAPNSRLFAMSLVFCGVVNLARITIRIRHERRPDVLSPRSWIILIVVCWVLSYGASYLSIWLVLDSRHAGSLPLNAVLLAMLVVSFFISIRFDFLNLSMSIPLLFPGVVLYFGGEALVLAFVFVTINMYALSCRKLFRRIVQAQVDQQDLAKSLDSQKDVAQDATLARTRFFAAASRDLRQPLDSIALLARSLNDMTVNPAQRAQAAGRMVEKVEALNQFFNQLLDFARIESGVTPVTRLHFRLSELLDRTGERYRPQAAEKGLALRVAPTTEVVYDDPVLLERVLGDLVSNAVRYTDSGAIWIGFRRAGQQSGGYSASATRAMRSRIDRATSLRGPGLVSRL